MDNGVSSDRNAIADMDRAGQDRPGKDPRIGADPWQARAARSHANRDILV
jgi:hypothetical protein